MKSQVMDLSIAQDLVLSGGPTLADYAVFTSLVDNIYESPRESKVSAVTTLRRILAPTLVCDCMQGFVYLKPHGYAGDFEILDRIYQNWLSPQPHLKRWDEYFRHQTAPQAVGNRKQYFIDCISSLKGRQSKVLNVASGPGRDLLEYFQLFPTTEHLFTCVDIDPDAIAYEQRLCAPFIRRVTFVQTNALCFQSTDRYDIIWSGGLFDYFEDRLFIVTLKHLLRLFAANGECIIGNFSTVNPTRPYMELGEWYLHHRTAEDLRTFAIRAGARPEMIDVRSEPLGVNLFLHIRKD